MKFPFVILTRTRWENIQAALKAWPVFCQTLIERNVSLKDERQPAPPEA